MDNFMLKFVYKGKPHILEVRPWHQQYRAVYKVVVEGQDVTFEQDEEGSLRAFGMAPVHGAPSHTIDAGLLQQIADGIEKHDGAKGEEE
jgi:hypothetical protein